MNVWIDNTSLYSVSKCIEKRASDPLDVRGLLQFALILTFCENIYLGGYEKGEVELATAEIIENIQNLGLEKNVIKLCFLHRNDFKTACLESSRQIIRTIEDGFMPLNRTLKTLEPNKASKAIKNELTILHTILEKMRNPLQNDFSSIIKREVELFERKESAPIIYMLQTDKILQKEIYQIVNNFKKWDIDSTRQLRAYIQCYFNDNLALKIPKLSGKQMKLFYTPAVSRALLVRYWNNSILDNLVDSTDQVIRKFRPKSLGLPSLYNSYVELSKGDPIILIKKSLEFRDEAADLRKMLISIIEKYDIEKIDDRISMEAEFLEIISIFEKKLLKKGSKYYDALECNITLGFPVSLNPKKFFEIRSYAKKSKKIQILTELSKYDLMPNNHFTYRKLLKNCGLH